MNNIITSPVTVGFTGYDAVEPKDLIVFSEEYLKFLPTLKTYIKQNENSFVQLPTTRVGKKGNPEFRILQGQIGSVTENAFVLHTQQDFNLPHEEGYDLHIRFDNVLGIVVLPIEMPTLNPFTVPLAIAYSAYVDIALPEMKGEMEKWLGVNHIARLHFHYEKENKIFRLGDYTTECRLIKVNHSNVEYEHIRTFVQLPGEEDYCYFDGRKGIETDRFIAPDRYLREVSLFAQ